MNTQKEKQFQGGGFKREPAHCNTPHSKHQQATATATATASNDSNDNQNKIKKKIKFTMINTISLPPLKYTLRFVHSTSSVVVQC